MSPEYACVTSPVLAALGYFFFGALAGASGILLWGALMLAHEESENDKC